MTTLTSLSVSLRGGEAYNCSSSRRKVTQCRDVYPNLTISEAYFDIGHDLSQYLGTGLENVFTTPYTPIFTLRVNDPTILQRRIPHFYSD